MASGQQSITFYTDRLVSDNISQCTHQVIPSHSKTEAFCPKVKITYCNVLKPERAKTYTFKEKIKGWIDK